MEEENRELEATLHQTEATSEPAPENTQEPTVQDAGSYDYNKEATNLIRLREAKERAEREKAELQAQLEAYRNQTKQEETPEEFLDDTERLQKEVDTVKKQLESYQKQQAMSADESRLKSIYSDFDQVVNNDTIAKLREVDPETAETIATSQASLYARGAAAYKRIKELNLDDRYAKDRQKAQENVNKPRPMNSVAPQTGDGPLSMANAFANGLTPELKKQLWAEMQAASKKI